MRKRIKHYCDMFEDAPMCPYLAERLINIISLEMYKHYVEINQEAYKRRRLRAKGKGYKGEVVISIFAFLRDNFVSDDEIMKVIGASQNEQNATGVQRN